jgi:hypothetical protein
MKKRNEGISRQKSIWKNDKMGGSNEMDGCPDDNEIYRCYDMVVTMKKRNEKIHIEFSQEKSTWENEEKGGSKDMGG